MIGKCVLSVMLLVATTFASCSFVGRGNDGVDNPYSGMIKSSEPEDLVGFLKENIDETMTVP